MYTFDTVDWLASRSDRITPVKEKLPVNTAYSGGGPQPFQRGSEKEKTSLIPGIGLSSPNQITRT
jgi:hypothetical protein